jgi:hypothetical protein
MHAAIDKGILPKADVGYLAAALSGIVFEVSVAMVSREPVDPDAATEFASRLMTGGLEALRRKGS